MYGLPSITLSHDTYRMVASWCVFAYIAAFTVISALMAVYEARKSILGACLTVIGGLFNVSRFIRERVSSLLGKNSEFVSEEQRTLFVK